MDDRELLELAAKAAGVSDGPEGFWCFDTEDWWNPLTDDGDALRLAVKLGLLKNDFNLENRMAYEINRNVSLDIFAATRRAIVRAATEIGRNMK